MPETAAPDPLAVIAQRLETRRLERKAERERQRKARAAAAEGTA